MHKPGIMGENNFRFPYKICTFIYTEFTTGIIHLNIIHRGDFLTISYIVLSPKKNHGMIHGRTECLPFVNRPSLRAMRRTDHAGNIPGIMRCRYIFLPGFFPW